jgi:hypothetical protein
MITTSFRHRSPAFWISRKGRNASSVSLTAHAPEHLFLPGDRVHHPEGWKSSHCRKGKDSQCCALKCACECHGGGSRI